ncbi:hypothetical protein [Acidovorax sp. A1169]|uniref:hypothetical protein n=1 Tax=Acidovorax sp. A1169 TaxID=3059524 RepID=UPI002737D148|nr:hypothetical protein [Acidovorax sp. A1169]MDP4074196.1 hypothetical protein [Acidovorax sp. A1169]
MSYTPPAGNAIAFAWVGGSAYTPPAGNAIAFSFASGGPTPVVGDGAITLDFMVEATAIHGVAVTGVGAVVLDFAVAAAGAHGVAGAGALSLDFAVACTAVHPRYEVRGVVRTGGVLLNRRVRAYDRDTGALLGQGDTVAGQFRVHAGFAERECCVLPIDLSPGAVDWRPPAANRVLSKLADDTA